MPYFVSDESERVDAENCYEPVRWQGNGKKLKKN